MAYPAYIREKARQMRRERRMPLTEIALRLSIPKTTVWYWIKDLPLVGTGQYLHTPRRTAAQQCAARANAARAKAVRDASYSRGLAEYPGLIAQPLFRDFLCLYVGEGYKRCRNRVSISNSDPRVLHVANYWMKRLAARPLVYSVHHHQDQEPNDLFRFWSSELGFQADDFRHHVKSNSGQLTGRTWRCKWGVLAITAHDTELRSRLQAWLDRLHEGWVDCLHSGV